MDGNDLEAIEAAIEAAKAETDKPSLIAVRTVIGYGSPKAGHEQGARRGDGRGGYGGDEEVLRVS
jgi:transketolase